MNLVELPPIMPEGTRFDMRYAGTNNVLGKVLYRPEDAVPKLDEHAAEALVHAADLLMRQGLNMVIWDAWRPTYAHKQLRSFNADPRFVLDEEASNHPKGLAVDLTIAFGANPPVDMGTDFDDFSEKAFSNNPVVTPAQRMNRQRLTTAMSAAGFERWPYEWWHFDYVGNGRGNGAG